ncbi:copper homeostasis protein CutC [Euzebyella saccharophila]|uniref:PF03932 family protein CutC n=1 Tax=Euzebyella saccharophila TaxID=679664 RepID=A0ABV8JQ19_9FLAO|nr:copper homeostasis protein CutC [Euzebyella saccharophila]
MLVEVCANSVQSALNAQKAGADRIELCSELAVGGITSSYGLLKKIRELISIPVHVLIRPRSGDFTYSQVEFEIMKENIQLCKDFGFAGIVSGVLGDRNNLDVERTAELVTLTGNLHFTFHRAFDWLSNPEDSLLQLQEMGVQTILSSGQATSSVEGLELLKSLQRKSEKITIMPGGGVKPNNAHLFKEAGFMAIHLSGTHFIPSLKVAPKVSMNTPSFLSDTKLAVTKLENIEDVVKAVK